LAEFRKAGGKHRIIENSVTRAAVELTIDGQSVEFSYDMEDAKRTGDCFKSDGKTLKHTWQKRPEDMLWARVISRGVRRMRPEIVAGLYTPEEVADFEPERGNGAPVAIAPEEAARRAKPIDATVTPFVATAESGAVLDATVCPAIGSEYDGMPWTHIPEDVLALALEAEGGVLRPAHKAAIKMVIADRNMPKE
jgi:hypothetical protein